MRFPGNDVPVQLRLRIGGSIARCSHKMAARSSGNGTSAGKGVGRIQVTATPCEVAEALEDTPGHLGAQRERFRGYGVMGLPFESGHVLACDGSPCRRSGRATPRSGIVRRMAGGASGRQPRPRSAAPAIRARFPTTRARPQSASPGPSHTVSRSPPTIRASPGRSRSQPRPRAGSLAHLPSDCPASSLPTRACCGSLVRSREPCSAPPPRPHRDNAQPPDLPPGAVACLDGNGQPRSAWSD